MKMIEYAEIKEISRGKYWVSWSGESPKFYEVGRQHKKDKFNYDGQIFDVDGFAHLALADGCRDCTIIYDNINTKIPWELMDAPMAISIIQMAVSLYHQSKKHPELVKGLLSTFK